MYAPGKNGILDDKGILIPEVMAARRRTSRSSSCAKVRSNSSTTTKERAPAASGCSR